MAFWMAASISANFSGRNAGLVTRREDWHPAPNDPQSPKNPAKMQNNEEFFINGVELYLARPHSAKLMLPRLAAGLFGEGA
jgi:hypothetical protein